MSHYSLFPAGRPAWTDFTYFDGDDALNHAECKALIDAGSAGERGPGLLGASIADTELRSVEKRDLEFGGDVLSVQAKVVDAALRANDQWWGFDLTHIHKMEVCRYGVGDHFLLHTDWGPGFTTRKLSVVVMLNDPAEFDGGALVFSSHVDSELTPKKGMIVVFPSFVPHRVQAVTRGERWSATAWIEGPPFR